MLSSLQEDVLRQATCRGHWLSDPLCTGRWKLDWDDGETCIIDNEYCTRKLFLNGSKRKLVLSGVIRRERPFFNVQSTRFHEMPKLRPVLFDGIILVLEQGQLQTEPFQWNSACNSPFDELHDFLEVADLARGVTNPDILQKWADCSRIVGRLLASQRGEDASRIAMFRRGVVL